MEYFEKIALWMDDPKLAMFPIAALGRMFWFDREILEKEKFASPKGGSINTSRNKTTYWNRVTSSWKQSV